MKSCKFFTLLVAATLTLSSGCKQDHPERASRPELPSVTVNTSTVEMTPVHNPVEILGTVKSAQRAEIAAKVTGTITSMPVVLGSDVNKGDLLVEISAKEMEAQLQKSRAEMNQAERNLERERKLLQKNASTSESVKSHEERLDIARAAFHEATTMLGYTRILAPFSGKVIEKRASTGDLATLGKVLLTIEDQNQLQVITEIPEAMLIKLNLGDTLPVSIPSSKLELMGTLSELSPTANPTTRTGKATLDLTFHPNLRTGMFARVALAGEEVHTLTIPQQAIMVSGQMEKVFVVETGKARLRLVRSGVTRGERVEILSGLKANEQVILTPEQPVLDGQPVTIR